ncbi:MAG: hypothetical protein MUF18_04235 [Fimbriiglobus sp.]|jgi:hypothetical protein|nr:hypothetical protein [Fimbriiglobus sp.]
MRNWIAVAVCVAVTTIGCAAEPKVEGKVYLPDDAKKQTITDKDVVRFEFSNPGSTGYTIAVKVTDGPATVEKWDRPAPRGAVGGGGPSYDIKPKAGKTGKIKVTVTQTPPGKGRPPEVTEYEFEVK